MNERTRSLWNELPTQPPKKLIPATKLADTTTSRQNPAPILIPTAATPSQPHRGFFLLPPLAALIAVSITALTLLTGCDKSPTSTQAAGTNVATTHTSHTLYNVSYDPTRELYQDLSAAFTATYKQQTGEDILIKNSHGGSGKQSRSVIDGGQADVVTLALAADVDAIANRAQLLPTDWQSKLPNNSAPYTSTINFLVRKGNPKGIHDWNDLIKPGVVVVAPDPKSSGGARWAYLAAWGQALKANNNDDAKARAYVKELYKHIPILDSGGRGSTVTFAQRDQGDVLLGWENDAYLALKEFGADKFEIVTPKVSILAEPVVAVVQKNAQRDGVEKEATDFLKYLYTPEAQEIIAKNFYRPRDEAAAKKYASNFPTVDLFTIDDIFGGWKKAQATHFADGAIYDQLQRENR